MATYGVSGRQLFLSRAGEGGPPVVFLSGAGLVGLDYFNLVEDLSRFTTSVLYDRAGTGQSDRMELPRSAAEVVEELRALLQAAEVPGPYLLAGHSLGGLYARRYAQLSPMRSPAFFCRIPATRTCTPTCRTEPASSTSS